MNKSVLITGANGGLGKECARQLALLSGTEKIYLACRNEERAMAAKLDLENSTGRKIFEFIKLDVTDQASVRQAVAGLPEPIEAVVMNAGGMGGKTPNQTNADGVTHSFATNVLGHAVLLDELLKSNKLTKVALYAGSEAARGVTKAGMKRPNLTSSSVDEFASICDGSYFGKTKDPIVAYGPAKYMAALWMSSQARQHPKIRFITMSPGGTSGTDIMDNLPPFLKFMYRHIGSRLMPLMGMMHGLEVGAKRFVSGLNDNLYDSGVFYASKLPVLTGPVVDQATLFSDLGNQTFQDNANEAIYRFIK